MPTTTGKIYLGSTLVAGGEGGGTTPVPVIVDWVRNPAWPALTAPGAAEQRIVGLYAVWPGDGVGNGGNFFSFQGRGAYTINFGDGTVTNYADNVKADYEYNFNAAALDGTNAPVTFTDATDRVNRAAHGFTNGSKAQFYGIAGTTGITTGVDYFVVNATADSFQVALTAGGSPLPLTGDGSATLLPYKIAVVTITPQGSGNLTVASFAQRHAATAVNYSSGWLDIAMSVPQVSGTGLTIGSQTVIHGYVERINIVAVGALTSLANFFRGLRSLQEITNLPSITSVTTTQDMYLDCRSLVRTKRFPGSAANLQNASNMHNGCYSLVEMAPLPGTVAAVTTISGYAANCTKLRTVPPFPGAFAVLANTSSAYLGMTNLETLPPLPGNTSTITNASNMHLACGNLQAIPPMNLSGVSTAANLNNFAGQCFSLARVQITGVRVSISFANCKLSPAAANEIFNGLAVVTGQTITMTGNYATSGPGYTPAIATAKGWTVA